VSEATERTRGRCSPEICTCHHDPRRSPSRRRPVEGTFACNATRWTHRPARDQPGGMPERCSEVEWAFGYATQVFGEAMNDLPEKSALLRASARQAEAASDWGEASRRWDVFCQEFPHLPAGPLGAAHAARLCGDWEKASEILRTAAVRFPELAEIVVQMARLAEARGLTAEAVVHFRQAIAIEPAYPFHYIHLAQIYYATSDFTAAEQVLVNGAEATGEDQHLLLELAYLAERQSDWRAAAQRLRQCLERFPDNTAAIVRLAAALGQQRMVTDAATILTAAIRRFPSCVELEIALIRLPGTGGVYEPREYLRHARLLHQ
jgi:tetratricopeptide (TPR) repeat protein